jgi:hypothetical protein
MRTPPTCGSCGVMGHTRRSCQVERLRNARESRGASLPPDEEHRMQVELVREFQNSPAGLRWATHLRELAERRELVMQRSQELRRERERERERRASEMRTQPTQAPPVNLAHSFAQVVSWARRAEREASSQMMSAARSLSLKMVGDFQEDYVVNDECAVCYDRAPNLGLPCKHTFCGECTVTFSKKAKSCPLCRASFQELHLPSNVSPENFNKLSASLAL